MEQTLKDVIKKIKKCPLGLSLGVGRSSLLGKAIVKVTKRF